MSVFPVIYCYFKNCHDYQHVIVKVKTFCIFLTAESMLDNCNLAVKSALVLLHIAKYFKKITSENFGTTKVALCMMECCREMKGESNSLKIA